MAGDFGELYPSGGRESTLKQNERFEAVAGPPFVIEGNFLPPAPPQDQISASLISVNNFLALTHDNPAWQVSNQKIETLGRLREVLEATLGHGAARENAPVAALARETTIAILDRIFIDEMSPDLLIGPAKSDYARSQGLIMPDAKQLDVTFPLVNNPKFLFFMTQPEQEWLLQTIIKDPDIIPLDSPAALDNTPHYGEYKKTYCFTVPLTLEQVNDVSDEWSQSAADQIIVPITIDSSAAGFFVYSRLKEPDPDMLPRSELPRQDVWRAFLAHGVPVTRKDASRDVFHQQEARVSHGDESQGSIEHVMKALGDLHDSASVDDPTRVKRASTRKAWIAARLHLGEFSGNLLKRHREFYERQFGETHPIFGRPDVYITRSGTSANETAIAAAEMITRAIGATRNAYMMSGWYFENVKSVREKFDVVSDVRKAHALFVNFEQTNQSYTSNHPNADYDTDRDATIQAFLQNASLHPQERFCMVVDMTANPAVDILSPDMPLPANVDIIKTFSMSKHQRGESSYFYGALFHWGQPGMGDAIGAFIPQTRGTLTPQGIAHLPRITKREIAGNIRQLTVKQKTFIKEFQKFMDRLPPESRWHVEAGSPFNCFFLPPPDKVWKTPMTAEMFAFQLGRLPEGVVWGDSFGLNDTRFSLGAGYFPNDQGGQDARRLLRMNIGLRTRYTTVRDLGRSIAETLSAISW